MQGKRAVLTSKVESLGRKGTLKEEISDTRYNAKKAEVALYSLAKCLLDLRKCNIF